MIYNILINKYDNLLKKIYRLSDYNYIKTFTIPYNPNKLNMKRIRILLNI